MSDHTAAPSNPHCLKTPLFDTQYPLHGFHCCHHLRHHYLKMWHEIQPLSNSQPKIFHLLHILECFISTPDVRWTRELQPSSQQHHHRFVQRHLHTNLLAPLSNDLHQCGTTPLQFSSRLPSTSNSKSSAYALNLQCSPSSCSKTSIIKFRT